MNCRFIGLTRWRVVGFTVVLTLLAPASGLASVAFSEPVAAEKFLDVKRLSQPSKEAVAEFRRAYRARNVLEFAHLPEEQRKNVVDVFERCIALGYETKLDEVNRQLRGLDALHPGEPVILWHLAMNYFFIARQMGHESRDARLELLSMAIKKSEQCIKIAPANADCWLVNAGARGTRALVAGIFQTLSRISGVRDALHQAFKLAKVNPYPLAPWKVDTLHAARAALAEFYRLAPDWWLFKVLTGVRGDKVRSFEFVQEMSVNEVGTANIVARSALCYGADNGDSAAIARGVEVVSRGVELDLIQAFDEPEYRRLARLYNGIVALKTFQPEDYYELGCHEFGNDDKGKLRESSASSPLGAIP